MLVYFNPVSFHDILEDPGCSVSYGEEAVAVLCPRFDVSREPAFCDGRRCGERAEATPVAENCLLLACDVCERQLAVRSALLDALLADSIIMGGFDDSWEGTMPVVEYGCSEKQAVRSKSSRGRTGRGGGSAAF